MVAVLDTNHFTELAHASTLGRRLMSRVEEHGAEVFSCIVAAEESLQGWIALIRRRRHGPEQLDPYSRLQQCIVTLNKLTMLPFDAESAERFLQLRRQLPRVGSVDLKIAAICLAHDATLLSRNLVDFQQVPRLRVENWLD